MGDESAAFLSSDSVYTDSSLIKLVLSLQVLASALLVQYFFLSIFFPAIFLF